MLFGLATVLARQTKGEAKPATLERGLVGYWRGNGDAIDQFERNNGVPNGQVTFVPSVAGQGFRFAMGNGDSAINLPESQTFAELTKSLTIASWVYIEQLPSGAQQSAMLVFRGDDRGGLDPFCLQVNRSSRLVFVINDEKYNVAEVSAPIPQNRFVHVAATLDDATGTMRLYINGEIAAGTTSTIRPLADLDSNANPGLALGNHASQGRSGFHYPFVGVLDDVRLYNRALGAKEARALFRSYGFARRDNG